MKNKINQVGPLDFGNVVERHREEGRMEAYERIINTLEALRNDGVEMDIGDLIEGVKLIKARGLS